MLPPPNLAVRELWNTRDSAHLFKGPLFASGLFPMHRHEGQTSLSGIWACTIMFVFTTWSGRPHTGAYPVGPHSHRAQGQARPADGDGHWDPVSCGRRYKGMFWSDGSVLCFKLNHVSRHRSIRLNSSESHILLHIIKYTSINISATPSHQLIQ